MKQWASFQALLKQPVTIARRATNQVVGSSNLSGRAKKKTGAYWKTPVGPFSLSNQRATSQADFVVARHQVQPSSSPGASTSATSAATCCAKGRRMGSGRRVASPYHSRCRAVRHLLLPSPTSASAARPPPPGPQECRVSLVNPSGDSCRRTDSLLGDSLCRPGTPRSGSGFATSSLRRSCSGFATPFANGLTACRMRSACCLRRLRVSRPFATPATRPRLRLPGTTRLRFALHGAQRPSSSPRAPASASLSARFGPAGGFACARRR